MNIEITGNMFQLTPFGLWSLYSSSQLSKWLMEGATSTNFKYSKLSCPAANTEYLALVCRFVCSYYTTEANPNYMPTLSWKPTYRVICQ